MIKKEVLSIFITGLFIALQGCCYDDKEVDVLLSNETPEQIYVHMRLSEITNGDDEGTKALFTRPWIFKKIPPYNTYKWEDIGANNGIWMVIIRQKTIDSYDSVYLASRCLYDSIMFFTTNQLYEINNKIEYKGGH